MDRNQMIEIVKRWMREDKEIRDEVNYYIDLLSDDGDGRPCDHLDAFVAFAELADEGRFGQATRRKSQRVLVELGMLRPITQEEVDQMVREGVGVKQSHFPSLNGQRYMSEGNFGQLRDTGRATC